MNIHHSDPSMGDSNYARIGHDFYPTEEWMTRGALRTLEDEGMLDTSLEWWEPACGEGHISKVIEEFFGAGGYSTDLIYRGFGKGGCDFLKQKVTPAGVRFIVTNPPFGDMAETFIRHALHLTEPVKGQVLMLLRNEYDCSKKRMNLFKEHPAYRAKVVSTTRPRWIAGTTGSPRHNYSWYFWDWTRESKDRPRIFYFNKQ